MSSELKVEIPETEISYPIKIGNHNRQELVIHLENLYNPEQVMLVTDDNVAGLYLEEIKKLFREKNLKVETYTLPAGEQAKSRKYLFEGYDRLLANNFGRDDPIIALGGGVVGDLAGYLAASFMRGVPLVQVPTTLLAQVDSSVGGKTAINHPEGKNLIGAFYQPDLVLIDVDFLDTLPLREIKTGLAEVIKYGFIDDPRFFSYLREHRRSIYELEPDSLEHIIQRSCEIKAQIVKQDQKEVSGTRALLNFGHTIAHALEAVTDYNTYTHGEAVAVGIRGALRLSADTGLLDRKQLDASESILDEYQLKSGIEEDIDLNKVYRAMRFDKKVRKNKLRWILLRGIGDPLIKTGIEKQLIMKTLEGLT
ncbi:MAG: 3-dehydroquinate synthase [Bacillota bacterium]